MSNHHISIPKSTLLTFSNSGNFNYLDLNDNTIHAGQASSYNTGKDYYPESTEAYLDSKIETKIGRLRKKLNSDREKVFYSDDTKQLVYPINKINRYDHNQLQEVVAFIFAQWLRTETLRNIIKGNSVLSNIIPDEYYQQYFNYNLKGNVEHAKNVKELHLNNLANTHNAIPSIIPTICESSFLLNSTHFFSFGDWVIFVLSPYTCICFVPKRYEKYENEPVMIFDDTTRNTLIKHSVQFEIKYGDGRLIGHKPQLLKAKDIKSDLMSELIKSGQ